MRILEYCALGLFCFIVGCSTPIRSSDFYLISNYIQHVPATGAKTVIIRCYCITRSATENSAVNDIELHMVGSWSSSGYIGPRDTPTAVPESLIRFKAAKSGDELVLESREYSFIHNGFLINSVEVLYPPGTAVSFEPVEPSELEGRNVE